MPKSIRIRTEPGVDRNINVKIDQDFDSLEILSLKLRQEDLYTQFCADYGVVVGRVIANGGVGVPNAHISIFIPIDQIDENDPVISTLYPYKSPEGKNEDGYRYNLLPYQNEYYGHTATGTFPTAEDVLTRKEVLHVYEKYYKYSVRTNEAGDFMIVGVPLGSQKLVMDLDLSNMGEFSLRPSDLIRMGQGVPSQFNGQLFKNSENIDSLPQILHEVKDIDVSSFWGADDTCDVGITRADFDLRELGIEITPHATFMGSIFSSNEDDYIKASCRPKKDTGNLCDTVTGPGTILALRQTIEEDSNGDPIIEEYFLEDGGEVIDDNGTWLVDLPMNLSFVTTNEFGERVISNDPKVGIPTQSKYRFKVKWQNEGALQAPIMRGNYLLPNIREHWDKNPSSNSSVPITDDAFNKSYAFSLDWSDYADKDAAIKCEDTFYLFNYNKVYTPASHIDRFKWGYNRASHYGIKEITDRACMSENNRFPTNDAQRNFDFLYFVFTILLNIVTPIILVIIPLMHVLALIYPVLRALINAFIWLYNKIVYNVCRVVAWLSTKQKKEDCETTPLTPLPKENPFKELTLPMIVYPDCEACQCDVSSLDEPTSNDTLNSVKDDPSQRGNTSSLSDVSNIGSYDIDFVDTCTPDQSGVDVVKEMSGMLYSGFDGLQPTDIWSNWKYGGSNTNISGKFYKTPFNVNGRNPIPLTGQQPFNLIAPYDVSLPQSLNLMNQRGRYFDNYKPNRIKTQIVNDEHGPTTQNSTTNEFEDMPLILLLDSGSSFDDGQILTFTNLDELNDPNVTGFTGAATGATNQYGNQGITGTFTNNSSNYVTKQISYIDPNGNEQTVNLDLVSLASGYSYNFKSGVEYFQVITTKTLAEANTLLTNHGNSSSSILHKHINMVTRRGCGNGVLLSPPQKPIELYDDSDDLVLAFLVRGVDPYSPKQKIRYDLSELFGASYGINPNLQFEGEYSLNIPIQKVHNSFRNGSDSTPEYHYEFNSPTFDTRNNNATHSKLFHTSFLYTPDSSQFTSFTSKAPALYSSVGYNIASSLRPQSDGQTVANGLQIGPGIPQGRVDGASYQYSLVPPNGNVSPTSNMLTVSPSYRLMTGTPNTNMVDSSKIVFRSDRLPVSTGRDLPIDLIYANLQDFALHLNNNFEIYKVSDDGSVSGTYPTVGVGATDGSGNSQDLETPSGLASNGVLDSFTCAKMVVFDCYSGSGENFGVQKPCNGSSLLGSLFGGSPEDRVVNGCYVFVKDPLLVSIPSDWKFFFEWRTRIRFMFGVCRGIIGHLFQNNWVNGTLYMPSFQKRTFFDGNNQVRRYKFCGDPNQSAFGMFFSNREYRGPLYFNTDSNSFFYRSAPYWNGQFKPQSTDNGVFTSFVGNNAGQMWQPTTIMDLGPKTEFLKEIMLTPEFESFLVDTIKSTSYQDISGILNLFIISRLIDSNLIQQILGLGDASIQKLFSRQYDNSVSLGNRFFDSRVDGDYAQLISINSEYGVIPYIDGNYADSITVGEIIGIWFDSEEELRREMGPGQITIGSVVSEFNYVSSQEVPFYGWKTNGTTNLFGDEENKWITDKFITAKYQDETFDGLLTDYPYSVSTNKGYGYLYNESTTDPEFDAKANTNSAHSDYYRVGSPFYFYFGLKRGKSALNRFIKKFVIIQD